MKYEKGNWKVVRDCCTSGNCITCRGSLNKMKKVRVTHGDNYSKEYAEHVAKNWASYNAIYQEMLSEGNDK